MNRSVDMEFAVNAEDLKFQVPGYVRIFFPHCPTCIRSAERTRRC